MHLTPLPAEPVEILTIYNINYYTTSSRYGGLVMSNLQARRKVVDSNLTKASCLHLWAEVFSLAATALM